MKDIMNEEITTEMFFSGYEYWRDIRQLLLLAKHKKYLNSVNIYSQVLQQTKLNSEPECILSNEIVDGKEHKTAKLESKGSRCEQNLVSHDIQSFQFKNISADDQILVLPPLEIKKEVPKKQFDRQQYEHQNVQQANQPSVNNQFLENVDKVELKILEKKYIPQGKQQIVVLDVSLNQQSILKDNHVENSQKKNINQTNQVEYLSFEQLQEANTHFKPIREIKQKVNDHHSLITKTAIVQTTEFNSNRLSEVIKCPLQQYHYNQPDVWRASEIINEFTSELDQNIINSGQNIKKQIQTSKSQSKCFLKKNELQQKLIEEQEQNQIQKQEKIKASRQMRMVKPVGTSNVGDDPYFYYGTRKFQCAENLPIITQPIQKISQNFNIPLKQKLFSFTSQNKYFNQIELQEVKIENFGQIQVTKVEHEGNLKEDLNPLIQQNSPFKLLQLDEQTRLNEFISAQERKLIEYHKYEEMKEGTSREEMLNQKNRLQEQLSVYWSRIDIFQQITSKIESLLAEFLDISTEVEGQGAGNLQDFHYNRALLGEISLEEFLFIEVQNFVSKNLLEFAVLIKEIINMFFITPLASKQYKQEIDIQGQGIVNRFSRSIKMPGFNKMGGMWFSNQLLRDLKLSESKLLVLRDQTIDNLDLLLKINYWPKKYKFTREKGTFERQKSVKDEAERNERLLEINKKLLLDVCKKKMEVKNINIYQHREYSNLENYLIKRHQDERKLSKKLQLHNQIKNYIMYVIRYIASNVVYDQHPKDVEFHRKILASFHLTYNKSDLQALTIPYPTYTVDALQQIISTVDNKEKFKKIKHFLFQKEMIKEYYPDFPSDETHSEFQEKFQLDHLEIEDLILNPLLLQKFNNEISRLTRFNEQNRIYMQKFCIFEYQDIILKGKGNKIDHFYGKNFILKALQTPTIFQI